MFIFIKNAKAGVDSTYMAFWKLLLPEMILMKWGIIRTICLIWSMQLDWGMQKKPYLDAFEFTVYFCWLFIYNAVHYQFLFSLNMNSFWQALLSKARWGRTQSNWGLMQSKNIAEPLSVTGLAAGPSSGFLTSLGFRLQAIHSLAGNLSKMDTRIMDK